VKMDLTVFVLNSLVPCMVRKRLTPTADALIPLVVDGQRLFCSVFRTTQGVNVCPSHSGDGIGGSTSVTGRFDSGGGL
jgi:hypothetical protein